MAPNYLIAGVALNPPTWVVMDPERTIYLQETEHSSALQPMKQNAILPSHASLIGAYAWDEVSKTFVKPSLLTLEKYPTRLYWVATNDKGTDKIYFRPIGLYRCELYKEDGTLIELEERDFKYHHYVFPGLRRLLSAPKGDMPIFSTSMHFQEAYGGGHRLFCVRLGICNPMKKRALPAPDTASGSTSSAQPPPKKTKNVKTYSDGLFQYKSKKMVKSSLTFNGVIFNKDIHGLPKSGLPLPEGSTVSLDISKGQLVVSLPSPSCEHVTLSIYSLDAPITSGSSSPPDESSDSPRYHSGSPRISEPDSPRYQPHLPGDSSPRYQPHLPDYSSPRYHPGSPEPEYRY